MPETRDPRAHGRFDLGGAALASLALAGTTWALTDAGGPATVWAAGLGLVAGVAFVVVERRVPEPMVPLGLFADRTFSAANAMTLLVYAALGAILFFLVLQLQTVSGYNALEAGLATLPVTICMLVLAARGGALAERIGPRIPMTFGPIVMAAGTLWLLVVGPDVTFWRDVAPGLTVFGLGLALMVAPLTATVLAAAPDEVTGIASGINNAVARAGSLLAVAALPMAVGLAGDDYRDAARFDTAYGSAMTACAVLLVLGGLISWFAIPQSRSAHRRLPKVFGMRVRRGAGVAAAAALGLLLGACSDPGASDAPDPTPTSETPSAEPSKTPSVPVADPAHAVDPPGERDGRLWSADILVQWDKPLDDALVKRIERLKGVAAHRAHRPRAGQPGEPGADRRVGRPGRLPPLHAADVADFQLAWDRVAGGEMAIDQKVAKRLADRDGNIRLGSDDDAPTLHVGAYTPQIPTIDMVVNTAWAADIEMATDNGLLISTDGTTPSTIRKPLERLVGKDASVQMLDVASRLGLDPDAKLTAIPTGGTLGSVVGTYRYRVLGGGLIAPEPSWVAANIRTEVVPILGSVTCHKDLFPQLRAALLEVQQRGLSPLDPPG